MNSHMLAHVVGKGQVIVILIYSMSMETANLPTCTHNEKLGEHGSALI